MHFEIKSMFQAGVGKKGRQTYVIGYFCWFQWFIQNIYHSLECCDPVLHDKSLDNKQ